eukprot:c12889_g1_i1.p1 GENE.c12889_g1_i1~~c12889_g1_i1.p1  ORF type:complete len:195 (+),score=40.89 c12889_g1_i1:247-831(+)
MGVGINDLLNAHDCEPMPMQHEAKHVPVSLPSVTSSPAVPAKRRHRQLLSLFRYEPYEFVIPCKSAPAPVLTRVSRACDDDIYLCHVYRMSDESDHTRGIVQFLTHGELSRGNKGHDHIRILQVKSNGKLYQSEPFLIKSTRAKFNHAAKCHRIKREASSDDSETDVPLQLISFEITEGEEAEARQPDPKCRRL